MADVPEYVEKILQDFKRTLADKVSEVQVALNDLNTVERRYNLEITKLETFAIHTPMSETASNVSTSASSSKPSVTSGAFVGMRPLEAAKRYIDIAHVTLNYDAILEGIVAGNAAIPQDSKWKEDLELRLSRSPDVLMVGDHTYGLTKFYTPEQVRIAREARRPAWATKPKQTAKRKATSKTKRKGKVTDKPITEKKRPELKLLESPPNNLNEDEANGTEP